MGLLPLVWTSLSQEGFSATCYTQNKRSVNVCVYICNRVVTCPGCSLHLTQCMLEYSPAAEQDKQAKQRNLSCVVIVAQIPLSPFYTQYTLSYTVYGSSLKTASTIHMKKIILTIFLQLFYFLSELLYLLLCCLQLRL